MITGMSWLLIVVMFGTNVPVVIEFQNKAVCEQTRESIREFSKNSGSQTPVKGLLNCVQGKLAK